MERDKIEEEIKLIGRRTEETLHIIVDHFSDMLNLMNLTWKEEEFYKYFIKLGLIINND